MPQDDVRVFRCERCGRETRICRSCDHGNQCCKRCAPLAAIERGRRSSAHYQETEKGRQNHKRRQQQYLERLAKAPRPPKTAPRKMTHRGSPKAPARRDLHKPSAGGSRDAQPPRSKRRSHQCPPRGHRVRCDFCGKVYITVCRTGFLPLVEPRRPRAPALDRLFVPRDRGS